MGSSADNIQPLQCRQATDFRTIVNCQHNSKKCDVIFRLDYKNNGQIKTLASWHEVYEGNYYPVDLDLSSLAGRDCEIYPRSKRKWCK